MPQNIYDNPDFFAAYDSMREARKGLNYALEQPAVRGLLTSETDIAGKRVLDMGCGAGEQTRWLIEQGAARALGVDISERMLEKAMARPHPKIEYLRSAAEDLELPDASFDLVVSSLMFHYVEDLHDLLTRVRRWLAPGGMLVFSTEHPMFTAAHGLFDDRWSRDADGNQEAWKVDGYLDEGKRVSKWFVDGVVRYHRTVSTLINTLIDTGFRITRALEPHAPEEEERRNPELLEERKAPAFIFIAAEAV
jgi:ubiquinone/menaquinone biosynthesis C-methylase UbiE